MPKHIILPHDIRRDNNKEYQALQNKLGLFAPYFPGDITFGSCIRGKYRIALNRIPEWFTNYTLEV
jgi:hypothetical protein